MAILISVVGVIHESPAEQTPDDRYRILDDESILIFHIKSAICYLQSDIRFVGDDALHRPVKIHRNGTGLCGHNTLQHKAILHRL